MRITAAAPEPLVYASNQLAMCLAYSIADGETYRGLNWVDASGNLYAAASFDALEEWVIFAQAPLQRPAWDVDEVVDMVAATQAQAVLVVSTEALLASPTSLTSIVGVSGVEALVAMGLTPKTETTEE
jgi:hypothetical protein